MILLTIGFGKVLEALTNSELVKHFTSQCLLSDKQYVLRFSISTSDLIIVIAESFCQALDTNGDAWAVALCISKMFGRVWYAGILHKLIK